MNKYWESETPNEVYTSKNILRYYKQAGRLSVSRPDWEDERGNMKPGKTVTFDISALSEEPAEVITAARSIFGDIISALEG